MSGQAVSIAAGTTNPAKVEAIEQAAADVLGDAQVEPVDVDPGVPPQPWGDEQTAHGALARARSALASLSRDYGIGIESGLVDGPGGRIYVVSWAAAIDRSGKLGFGGSERFALPPSLEAALRQGAELGPLLDELLDQSGLARRDGAVSIFTQGRRKRVEILSVAVLHALIALIGPGKTA